MTYKADDVSQERWNIYHEDKNPLLFFKFSLSLIHFYNFLLTNVIRAVHYLVISRLISQMTTLPRENIESVVWTYRQIREAGV